MVVDASLLLTTLTKIKDNKLTSVKIADLKFDKDNPNRLTQAQIKGIRESFARFGNLHPIVIDKQTGMIADGEHRAVVYKELGIKEIPAYVKKFKNNAERRLCRQVMNKLHGQHEKQLDADEIAYLFENKELENLAKLTGQDKEDLERLTLRYHPGLEFVTPENDQEIDAIIDEELKKNSPDTQLGDIYQLGEHRLACGDSTDTRLVSKLMNGNKANMVFTDPPYNIKFGRLEDGKPGYRIYDDNKSKRAYWDDLIKPVLSNLYANTEEDSAAFYVWSAAANLCMMRAAFEETGVHFHQWLYWVKATLGLMGESDYQYNLEALTYGYKGKHYFYHRKAAHLVAQQFRQENDELISKSDHHARKPVTLVKEYLQNSSKQGQKVLDLFLGLGSTLIACEQTQRSCYGCEIDPRYCDVVIKRWEKYTGKKAVKLN